MRSVFYAGSFDPVTLGHIDVLRQCFCLADRVVVGIGVHPGKVPLFSVEERAQMVREGTADFLQHGTKTLDVVTFDGLVITAARAAGASVMVRGLRDGTDLDYEMQMAGMNAQMAPDISTVFVPASVPVRPITATLVRQIAKMGGDVSAFVPPSVARRLTARFASPSAS